MADHAPVVIRPLEAADLEAAVSLFAAVAAEGRYVGGEAPVDRDARRQRLVVALDSKGDTSFVAEADGELVGHVQVVLRNGLADLGILVASGWRGRGIGSQLMARSLAWCKDNNAHKVTLSVWPHNTAAIAMYEKFGFVEEGRCGATTGDVTASSGTPSRWVSSSTRSRPARPGDAPKPLALSKPPAARH